MTDKNLQRSAEKPIVFLKNDEFFFDASTLRKSSITKRSLKLELSGHRDRNTKKRTQTKEMRDEKVEDDSSRNGKKGLSK